MTLIYYFKELLNDRKLMKDCVTLAIPIMFQTLIVSSVNLVDNLMVAQLGDVALSAVVSANKYYNIITFVINSLISSCAIYLSQFNGAGNKEKMKETFRFSFVSTYLFIIIGFLIVLTLPETLIRFIIDDKDVIVNGSEYLRYACFSYLPMGISMAISGSMRVVGDSKTPMKISIVSIVINAVLDYGLIFGRFGLPMLKIKGAAIATVIARIIEAFLYLWAMKKRDYDFKTDINKLFCFDINLAKEIIIRAIPLVANEFMWSFGMTFLMKAYSSRGAVVNAAYSISNTVSDIFFILFSGMAIASTVLIGTPLGAGQLEKAKENGYKLICFSVILASLFGIMMYFSSYIIPFIYSNVSDESILCAQIFLKTIGCLYWIFMFNTQCYFTLRAGGDTKSTVFMDSGFMWVANIPIVCILAYFTDISIYVVYILGQLTDLIKSFIAFYLVKKEKWVRNLAEEKS